MIRNLPALGRRRAEVLVTPRPDLAQVAGAAMHPTPSIAVRPRIATFLAASWMIRRSPMTIPAEIAVAVIIVWLAANGVAFLVLLWGIHKQRGANR
jgi:hypothetical protein